MLKKRSENKVLTKSEQNKINTQAGAKNRWNMLNAIIFFSGWLRITTVEQTLHTTKENSLKEGYLLELAFYK